MEANAVEFTQPSHRDDPQGDNVPRGFCYPIRSKWYSSVLNGLPRLVERGRDRADLFGIEHAGIRVYLKQTVHSPRLKFSCRHGAILTDMGHMPAFHCWTRAVLIAPAPTASTTQVFLTRRPRANSKQAAAIRLLKRPEGATIAAILKATRVLGLHRCP